MLIDMLRSIQKLLYPLLIAFNRFTGIRRRIYSSAVKSKASFYGLSMTASRGERFDFSSLAGKKVLIVNTASQCGYTHQYAELQYLFSTVPSGLVIIAFPSADFANQELGNDEAIQNFCSKYRIAFPLMQKSVVKKKPGQNPVFHWLTHKESNGWNDRPPSWNFGKYLVDEEGNLTHVFETAVTPEEIRKYL